MFPTHSSNKGKKKTHNFCRLALRIFLPPPKKKKIKFKKEKDVLFRIKFNVS